LKGELYLIPTPLGETEPSLVLPESVLNIIPQLKLFVVEEVRSARRFLSKTGHKGAIDSLTLLELNEHTKSEEYSAIMEAVLKEGRAGLISEAGLPAVADPGAGLVELCHVHDVKVIPLTGPSSLMMALMASGKNGQSFAFNGYLPVKPEARKSKIKQLERLSVVNGQTQIMIETPYRNNSLLSDFISVCDKGTKLTVACNIGMSDEYIKTLTMTDWKRVNPDLNKRPAVFIL